MENLENKYDGVNWANRASEFFKKMSIFAIMSQSLSFISGSAESLKINHLFGLPFLLLANILKAIESFQQFIHDPNKNLPALLAMLYDVFIVVSLPLTLFLLAVLPIGAITSVVGIVLTAAVYFAIETAYHLFATISNCFKALLAPRGSIERKVYTQRALEHLGKAAISGLITALFFVPMAQPIAIGLAVTTIAFSLGQAFWQISPNLRHKVKSFLGIEIMPDARDEEVKIQNKSLLELRTEKASIRNQKFEASHHANLFKRAYRKTVVNRYIALNHHDDARNYLLDEIEIKLKQWPLNPTGKQSEKRNALIKAKGLLENYEQRKQQQNPVREQEIMVLANSPEVHQSFFSDISDTMDLLLATAIFVDKARLLPPVANDVSTQHQQQAI